MQFLWQGLLEGETVAFDVLDKPFPRLRQYFKSFGWDIEPFGEKGKFIAIQAFPHFDNMANIDIMTAASVSDPAAKRALDLELNTAHNIIYFRVNEETYQRELRVVKMEGTPHPLGWIPFKITGKGIELMPK